MGDELAGVVVQQPFAAPGTPFPPPPYVRSAGRPKNAPRPVAAVHRDRADGIVGLQSALDEEHRPADQDSGCAGDRSGDEGAPRGNRDQPGERPAPLASIEGSGVPYFIHMYNIAPMLPAAPASMVLVAITPMRRSDPARVDPGLNPNHLKQREDECPNQRRRIL
jgi:hypothetical protein